jgi:hypothetical protein
MGSARHLYKSFGVKGLKMSGCVPLISLYSFMAWAGTVLSFKNETSYTSNTIQRIFKYQQSDG